MNSLAFLFKIILKITNKPVVMCYHRITARMLDEQVTFLNKLGIIQPFKKLVNDCINAKPSFSIALTMDDCYYEDFIHATQVFEKHQLPCTFFVPTQYSIDNTTLWPKKVINMFHQNGLSFIDEDGKEVTFTNYQEKEAYKNDLINKLAGDDTQTVNIEKRVSRVCLFNNYTSDAADIVIGKEIIKQYANHTLFSFQSHTVTHPKLYLQTESELAFEFEESRRYLQETTGEEQYLICYPYGSARHIGNTHRTASKYYTHGVTLQAGSIHKNTNSMLIPRIGIYEHDTPLRILLKILNSQFKS